MIYDKISNGKNYKGISKNLDTALDFITSLDPSKLVVGKHQIDGDKVFYMVQDYATKPESECKYETHKKYIDIQLLVTGKEIIRCNTFNKPNVTVPYNPEKDIEFYTIDKGYDFLLDGETFALVFPDELHAPKVAEAQPVDVRKVVVKILY